MNRYLDALIGGLAGIAYWWALAVGLEVPDAPTLMPCITFGAVAGIVSRYMRRAADGC